MSSDDESRPAPWRRYLRFWRSDIEADVREEIGFHIDELVAQQVAAGVPEAEARRIAEARFGNAETIGRAMRALAAQRETTMRRTEYFQHLLQDLRYAGRQLAKRPGFTAVAILTLALGIGANTAIFSAVNSVLLHPLPVPNVGQMAFVRENIPALPLMKAPLDPAEVLEMSDHPGVFQNIGGVATGSMVTAGDGQPRRMVGAHTLGHFFDAFAIKPVVGRFYRPEESEPARSRVAVLSYDLWQELGGQPSIIGTRLQFIVGSYEVVGVAPRGFGFPRSAQLWIPYPIAPAGACGDGQRTPDGFPCRVYHGVMIMSVVGRLRPGVKTVEVEQYLDRTVASLHPDKPRNEYYYTSEGFVEGIAGELRPALLALLGAVGFVLLIACANVASLQLVHGTARSRELAVRTALGAPRGAIIRQLLVENLVLAISGGIVGLVLGALILKLLAVTGASDISQLASVRLDRSVLAFTSIVTIVSGVFFGMIPAIRASRVDLRSGLKEGGRGQSLGARTNRLLQGGVMLQMALTVVLLLGSALMIRTVKALLDQDPGFQAENVSTMRFTRYAKSPLGPFYDGILERLRGTPGVLSAALVSDLPFTGGGDSSPFKIDGAPTDPDGPALHANTEAVGGDYFQAMGIRMVRGRAFNDGDSKTSEPVAIIDAQLARQFFGDENPIGKRITQGGPWATIVGVASSVSQVELGEPLKATIYFPVDQHDWYSNMYVVVRSALPLGTISGLVRSAVANVDPTAPVYDQRLLTERMSASLAPRRLTMSVMSGLAVVSLLLATFGLYGVISYVVSQRTTEFGIRLALGAQPGQVRGMVVRQGVAVAIVGIAVGVVVAAAGTRSLSALLYGVSNHDLATFVTAPALLAVIAVVASYVPARRVTRVNPTDALRGGE